MKFDNQMQEDIQMSEAFITSVFLALSGGFQDAYTYFTRNEVFSNAQTGNIVLMSTHLMMGEWLDVLRYLFPLLAFAGGVFFAVFAVGFMPAKLDLLATALVSFACAMQVQTFRKVSGYSYASTMCIGNLRSGTEAFTSYLHTHDTEKLKKALYYFGIILFFGLGAGIGGNLSIRYGFHIIWVSSGLLLISFLLMFVEKKG